MVIQLKNEKTNELFTSKEQTAQYRLHAVPRPFALQKKVPHPSLPPILPACEADEAMAAGHPCHVTKR
jgi:hypothetical protein